MVSNFPPLVGGIEGGGLNSSHPFNLGFLDNQIILNGRNLNSIKDDKVNYAHKKIVCQATKWHLYVFYNTPIDPSDPGRPPGLIPSAP